MLCQRIRFLWHFLFLGQFFAPGSHGPYNLQSLGFLWQIEVIMASTLADSYPHFLNDLAHKHQLRASTLRAYQYELAAAAENSRFHKPLPGVKQTLL